MKSAGRERRVGGVALVLCCLILGASCKDAAPPAGSDPTVTEAPPTTPTTEPQPTTTSLVPLDQDPPVVDRAYAQRVLDEISRLIANASLVLYRAKQVTPEYDEMIAAIYASDALADSQEATRIDMSVGLAAWQDPPGAPLYTAKRILSTRAGCITLIANSDYRPRYKVPVDVDIGVGVVLRRNSQPTPGTRRANPSSWVLYGAGEIAPGRDLGELCR